MIVGVIIFIFTRDIADKDLELLNVLSRESRNLQSFKRDNLRELRINKNEVKLLGDSISGIQKRIRENNPFFDKEDLEIDLEELQLTLNNMQDRVLNGADEIVQIDKSLEDIEDRKKGRITTSTDAWISFLQFNTTRFGPLLIILFLVSIFISQMRLLRLMES